MMVDYLTDTATATTQEANVRVAAGVAIGGLNVQTAFAWRPASSGFFQLGGSLSGANEALTIVGAESDVLVQATGSIWGGGASIRGALRTLTNFGSLATFVESTAAAFTVRNYGLIADDVIEAIKHSGNGAASIVNAGSIIGSSRAILLGSQGGNSILNTGTITSINPTGVLISTFASNLTLTNYGLIAGGTARAIQTSSGRFEDIIVNAGHIVGGIVLGGGSDRYDNSLGTTTGLVDLGDEADTGIGGAGVDRINGGRGSDTLSGAGGDDVLDGGADDDVMNGGSGDDVMTGGDGSDVLDGGTGIDRLTGGAGDDEFRVDDARDLVFETANGGIDMVTTLVSYFLRAGQVIEALRADPSGNLTGLTLTGNEFGQRITGDSGENRIAGGGGSDVLEGLAGNDTYIVADSSDIVIEARSGGYDVILTEGTYVLPDNVEELRAAEPQGSAAIALNGNDLRNRIIGNAGDNRIDGGIGADTMIGGAGDDTYVVDDSRDIVTDSSGEDTVVAAVDYLLPNAIEHLVLSGPAGRGTGNKLANTITGNEGDDVLNGAGGRDTLTGGEGADRFVIDAAIRAENFAAIADFVGGADTIALSAATFRRIGGAGSLDPRFFTDGVATTADHHILYDSASGVVSYDLDGSGTRAAAVAFASVGAGTLLSADDFLIFGNAAGATMSSWAGGHHATALAGDVVLV